VTNRSNIRVRQLAPLIRRRYFTLGTQRWSRRREKRQDLRPRQRGAVPCSGVGQLCLMRALVVLMNVLFRHCRCHLRSYRTSHANVSQLQNPANRQERIHSLVLRYGRSLRWSTTSGPQKNAGRRDRDHKVILLQEAPTRNGDDDIPVNDAGTSTNRGGRGSY
jgi:hypothetical protein